MKLKNLVLALCCTLLAVAFNASAITIVPDATETCTVQANTQIVCTTNSITKLICPAGMTGTPPNCVATTCPAGTTGTPPNCSPIVGCAGGVVQTFQYNLSGSYQGPFDPGTQGGFYTPTTTFGNNTIVFAIDRPYQFDVRVDEYQGQGTSRKSWLSSTPCGPLDIPGFDYVQYSNGAEFIGAVTPDTPAVFYLMVQNRNRAGASTCVGGICQVGITLSGQ